MIKYKVWPIGISLLFSIFVISLILYLIFASFYNVELVSDDYYGEELIYQEQIDRIWRSRQADYKILIKYIVENDEIIVQFPAELDYSDIRGRMILFRPSESTMDQNIQIRLSGTGKQSIPTSKLANGYWRIKIFWQNQDGKFYDEVKIVIATNGGQING